MKRSFKFDKKLGQMVDVTPEADKPLLAEIARSLAPIKKLRKGRKSAFANGRPAAKWPIISHAMGIDPEDIPRAQRILSEHGVHSEYTKDGEAILTSQYHRKRHAEALGFYDRNGGYGDPQPKNR